MDQMDQNLLRQREAKCIQEKPPGCMSECPVHVDVKGIVEAIDKKDYAKGFALFCRVVPFPGIICRICDQPCQQACKRQEIDEAIFIRALEKVCVDNNQTVYDIVPRLLKEKAVAIIGGGLSGLTAAFELGRKGYKVEVFEATERLGGRLWNYSESELPRQVIHEDFSAFAKLPIEIHYNTRITCLDCLIDQVDAIYVATGFQKKLDEEFHFNRNEDGMLEIDLLTLAVGQKNIFAGGGVRGNKENYSPISSLSDGKIAAISIDRLFQNVSLSANRANEGSFTTSLYTNTQGIIPKRMVQPSDLADGYSEEEACQEAERCLLCECLECVKVCEYLAHYRSYPKRYVREIYNNLSIVMGIHRANKMINSCSLCGLCEKVCPGNLNMGEICLEARRMMVDKGKMPLSTYDFALRDMKFSNSSHCTLNKNQPGFSSSRYAFFPGCQLTASSPQQVKQTYDFLCEKLNDGVGLMLDCCGAPANWAGQKALFQETMQSIELHWEALGKPCIITACPSCHKLFKENLPNVSIESLWVLLKQTGLPEEAGMIHTPKKLAIHDSCAARQEYFMQDGVRDIAAKLGYQVEELPLHRENTVCCSYGGLMAHANKEVAGKVIQRRIEESKSDYLTYCAMCRDNFASRGKRVYHVLDLLFSKNKDFAAGQKGPGYSKRQENREKLKIAFLQDIWGERVEEVKKEVELIISENVSSLMEERMILVEDVAKVIAYAESSGNKLRNTGEKSFIAYHQLDNVTYWVEYFPENDAFIVKNTYCHRINIAD